MNIQIAQIDQSQELLDQVIALGDANKRYLGFLPGGAFKKFAEEGSILVALDMSSNVLGYLLYRLVSSKRQVSIVHLCVDEGHSGKGIGAKLVKELKKITVDYYGISLFCRRDFPSNKFWPRVGFNYIGEKKGRGKEQLPLTCYRFDHDQPTIFTQVNQTRLDDAEIKAVIDANVFFNLHDQDDHPLLADWLSNDLVLTVSDELQNEIQRDSDDERRSSAISYAQNFPVISCSISKKKEVANLLRKYYPNDISLRDESDIKQVSHAVAADVLFFITKDVPLKSKLKEVVKELFNLSIISPDELVIYLDQLINDEKYELKKLSGTDFSLSCLKSEDVDLVAETFHRLNGGKKTVFRKRLELYLNDPATYEVYTVGNSGKLIAIAAVTYSRENELEIPLFRVCEGAFSPNIEFQLLLKLVSKAVETNSEVVKFTDRFIQEGTFEALKQNNFLLSKDTNWVKINLIGIKSASEISKHISSIEEMHTSTREVISNIRNNLGLINSNGDIEDVASLEKACWPLKVSSFSLDTYLVPIQPVWAMELFDSNLGEQSLFNANAELILQIENVYYRSARTEAPTCPARVLWYVSKGEGSTRWHGTSTIRACSYVEKVTIGSPKELFKKFSKLGVYKWDNIIEAAGGNIDKKILAFHFSRTELFDNPVSLSEIARITGRNSAPISPVTITNDKFIELYELGMARKEGKL